MFEGLFRPMHMLLILFIVLVIFGPSKLPQIGEGLGKSIRDFKKAMRDDQDSTTLDQKREEKKV